MKDVALPRALTEHSAAGVNDEPGNEAAYKEYARGFDDVPVLFDAVRIPPRRSTEPDFRRGERRDVRKEPRSDGYAARESTLEQLELLYEEYSRPEPPTPSRPTKKKRKKASKRSRAKSRKS